MEIPDIVRLIAALLPSEDRVCLALVSRTCYDALPDELTPYKRDRMFHLAAGDRFLLASVLVVIQLRHRMDRG